jgi:hypothetical protein
VKAYKILPTLVVNNDQIGVHFISIVGLKTWENKISKHIQILKVKNNIFLEWLYF